jgi:ribulose kinase
MEPVYDGGVRKELDEVTALLCGLMHVIENVGSTATGATRIKNHVNVNKDLGKWWKHHKAIDEAERLRKENKKRLERIRKTALSKLTPEERKLLGIK